MRHKRTTIAFVAAALVLNLASCAPGAATASLTPGPISATTTLPSATLPSSTSTASGGTLKVYFLDVGQGDSEIITIGGMAVLIDAGTDASTTALINDIKNLGISRFDVVIGTHPNDDHIGGMAAVINQFEIGTIYMPRVSPDTKTYNDLLAAIKNKGLSVSAPEPAKTFGLGAAFCTIMAPNGTTYEDLKNYSVVIRLDYVTTSFLFTGDAQLDSENEMLARHYNLKADVLKVSDHGSSSATSLSFLGDVAPEYAVIEVGADNPSGDPESTTLGKLANDGVKVYRTDLNGTVTFTSDGRSLKVSTER
jgi:competence protein ComEC